MSTISQIKKIGNYLIENAERIALTGGEKIELSIEVTKDSCDLDFRAQINLADYDTLANKTSMFMPKHETKVNRFEQGIEQRPNESSGKTLSQRIQTLLAPDQIMEYSDNTNNTIVTVTDNIKQKNPEKVFKRTVLFMRKEDMLTFVRLMENEYNIGVPSKEVMNLEKESSIYTITCKNTNQKIRKFGYTHYCVFRMNSDNFKKLSNDFGLISPEKELKKLVGSVSVKCYI